MDGFKKFVTHYKKSDTLYKVGDTQGDFYIINKGKVQLKIAENDQPIVTLSKGDFFGEESLNENQDAVYTAEVLEDSDIIKIPYNSLVDMMKKSNSISLKILKKLAEKHVKVLNNTLELKKTEALSSPPKKKKGTKKTGNPMYTGSANHGLTTDCRLVL